MILSFPEGTTTSDARIPRLELIVRAQGALLDTGARLGVFGGAYNPITRAHLVLARSAASQMHLHEVIFVLSRIPPHKPLFGSSIGQRLEMMRLAAAEVPFASVGLCSHGLFLDICAALRKVYPQNPELFFITGRDAAERILSWPYADPDEALKKMFSEFQLLVFERHGKLTLPAIPLIQQYSSRIHPMQLPEDLEHISSTRVRQLTRTGRPLEDLVPEEVAAYIAKHGLYRGEE
jgi:nicotinate-nucleotide adenylyltransferase